MSETFCVHGYGSRSTILCPMCAPVKSASKDIIATVRADMYERIEKWRADFEQKGKTGSHGSDRYYADAASGLAIALQEIDRERYDAETKQ